MSFFQALVRERVLGLLTTLSQSAQFVQAQIHRVRESSLQRHGSSRAKGFLAVVDRLLELYRKGLALSDVLVLLRHEAHGYEPAETVATSLGISKRTVDRSYSFLRGLGLMEQSSRATPPDAKPLTKPERLAIEDRPSWHRLNPRRHRVNQVWRQMQERAEAGGFPFDLTKDQLEGMLDRAVACPACGVELDHSYAPGKDKRRAPSVDKFVPQNGYVLNNVNIICYRCNTLKRDASGDELSRIASWVARTAQC